jgi:type I restriction enzyme S subunit
VTYSRKILRKEFLDQGRFPIVSQEDGLINGYWNDEADLFKVTRPVIVFGDHTRVLKYVDFNFVIGADGVKILQPQTFLLPKYLYYYLTAADISPLGYARHYRLLRELTIAYPPFPEQQRIVGILDEAFDGIATATANAAKNLQNARALFESHLDSVFAKRGNGWVEKPLREYANSISTDPFGSMLHKSDYVTAGVPLVNPINIIDGAIVPDPTKLLDKSTQDRLQSYVLQEHDIVIGRRGEIGRCAVVGANEAGWICGTGCFFIRPGPSVNSEFLSHLIRSRTYRSELEQVSTGATMKNLSNRALGDLKVAIPNMTDQLRMISSINTLAAETRRLESLYYQKLAALEELKQSLLHHAFTGAL